MNYILQTIVTAAICWVVKIITQKYFTQVKPDKVVAVVKAAVTDVMKVAEQYKKAKADGSLTNDEKKELFTTAITLIRDRLRQYELPEQDYDFLQTLIEGEVEVQKK